MTQQIQGGAKRAIVSYVSLKRCETFSKWWPIFRILSVRHKSKFVTKLSRKIQPNFKHVAKVNLWSMWHFLTHTDQHIELFASPCSWSDRDLPYIGFARYTVGRQRREDSSLASYYHIQNWLYCNSTLAGRPAMDDCCLLIFIVRQHYGSPGLCSISSHLIFYSLKAVVKLSSS